MKKRSSLRGLRVRALLAAGACAAGCAGPGAPEPADLLIRHAKVYTLEEAQPQAQAVAVRGERIVFVGDDAGAEALLGPDTKVIDAGGRLLLPGFIDSHNHIRTGSDPDVVKLHAASSLAEIQRRVREFAAAHPEMPWIEGEGWNYSAFPGGRLPTSADLAGLAGGRPVFLISYDVHTAWLDREALGRFGIGPGTRRVEFGIVELDPVTGEPTGIVSEFATLGISKAGEARLEAVLPSHSEARSYRSLQRSLEDAARFGITTVVDPQVDLDDLALFERARADGILGARLQLALFHAPETTEAELAHFAEAMRRLDDDRLRVSALKLYIDDVIEPRTAALLEPYADRPGKRGETLYPPERFAEVVTRLDRSGFQLFIHAIGDRGVRVALDALERARAANGARDSRHQLVHVELLSPEDVPRFRALGVVACMQPRHAAPDITGQWAAAVGPARWPYAFAWASLARAGATLAFASDWNVAEMDPLVGIYSALTRQGPGGSPPGGWVPEQRVDLATALRAYTRDGAFANFVEDDRGSIAPGKYADLILLSDDLWALPPERIPSARVLLTLVGGEAVYTAP